jgi:hypothetical protein
MTMLSFFVTIESRDGAILDERTKTNLTFSSRWRLLYIDIRCRLADFSLKYEFTDSIKETASIIYAEFLCQLFTSQDAADHKQMIFWGG